MRKRMKNLYVEVTKYWDKITDYSFAEKNMKYEFNVHRSLTEN